MSLRSTLVLGSTLAILATAAVTSEARAICWLCFVDGGDSWCTPSGNQHAGYKQCVTVQVGSHQVCQLSGDFCGITVLEDVGADGSRLPLVEALVDLLSA